MSKSRDIADSAATINYIDTVTSNVQDQIDNIYPLPSQTGNNGKFLTTDGTDASWTEVSSSPTLEAIASGSLANGDLVVINADGTVSVVSGQTSSIGTPVEFNNANTVFISSTFDSNSNKVVVAYVDQGNSNYGTAIVGTVSGTSISFGSEAVFNSGTTNELSVTFDSSNNKIIIAYKDNANSSYGTAIIGTVSGTSISFGSAVVFESSESISIYSIFDSLNNKVVIIYKTVPNYYGKAIIGTVSGTSISFGSAVTFNAANTGYQTPVFDSENNKIVIVYEDNGNSGYSTAIVGTVSGTSISFGTPVVVNSRNNTRFGITFDSNTNKILVAYRAQTVDSGQAQVGTVSGTTTTWGDPVIFESLSTLTISAAFDSNSNQVIITYTAASANAKFISGKISGSTVSFSNSETLDSGNAHYSHVSFDSNLNKMVYSYTTTTSGSADSIVFTPSFTNLTSQNYIGISDGAYSDSATAKVQIIGSVDDAQSGLTAGVAYYVQIDGTLSDIAGTPSVFAGTAVSATKLIVKG